MICGEYEQEALIGSGSFGKVYRCRHIKTGKLYAIKEFKHKYNSRKKAMECKEIQIMAKFDQAEKVNKYHCPYILKAETVEYDNRKLYAIFELMEMSLTQFLRKRAKMAKPMLDENTEVKVIMKQLLIAM